MLPYHQIFRKGRKQNSHPICEVIEKRLLEGLNVYNRQHT